MKPRFSVLTPVFDGEETLARAIESVMAQDRDDWELIVVDDGSHDSSLAIARAYAEGDPRIVAVEQEHRGVHETRTRAMEHACGTWFVRLDADDELMPTYLSDIDDMICRYPDATLISTNGFQVFPDGARVYYYTQPIFQTECSLTLSDVLRGAAFGTSTVMHRSVYEATGGARPETYSEDPDLWMRALSLGAVHRHLPKPVFLYYQHEGSVSSDARRVWESHAEIMTHLIASGRLSAEEVRLAKRARAKYRLRLALRWDVWGTPVRKKMARRTRHGS